MVERTRITFSISINSFKHAWKKTWHCRKKRNFFSHFLDKNHCAGNACNGRGQCQSGANDYTCECKDGYDGKDCQIGNQLINFSLQWLIFLFNNSFFTIKIYDIICFVQT